MSVYLYTGGFEIVRKSGVGQAILHQKKALEMTGMETDIRMGRDTKTAHINTVFPDSFITALRAKKRGIKVIYYAHSTMEDFRRSFRGSNALAPLFKKWIMLCYGLGDVILTPTEYSKKILESYGLRKNIYSISNGVDTDYFHPSRKHRNAFRSRYQLSEGDKVVISVGHTIERKGVLDYIEIARRMPDVRFFWFGHTDQSLLPQTVRDAIRCAPDNLKFMGYVEQKALRDAYCGADVFAFLSREETEGIVVLEALACGIPTVVRDIPVYNGWLTHGENVYKADSVKGFEYFIYRLLYQMQPNLTCAGRAAAEMRNFRAVGERLKEIYRAEGFLPEE